MNAVASKYATIERDLWTQDDEYSEQSLNSIKYDLPNLANPSSFLKSHTDE